MDAGLDRRMRILAPAVVFAVFLGVWWAAVAAGDGLIVPTPWQVALGIAELARQGLLLDHVTASLARVAGGYGLALALGIPLGIAMGWFPGVFAAFNPMIQLLRPISPIAWIPLAILWFGIGDLSPVFLIFLSSFFPIVVNATTGVHTIEQRYIRASANFGISGFRLLRLVILPAALPHIIVGMRISLGVA
jgi:NitT/TauT family transport system permease protein